jgi:hypothetical protein
MTRTAMVVLFGVWAGVTASARAGKHTEVISSMPHSASAPVVIIYESAEAPVCKCKKAPRGARVRSCVSRLKEWLCFRPCEKPEACGCHQGAPCCTPPTHAFFLHRCRSCRHDTYQGEVIPIGFSYTDLLRHSAPYLGTGCSTCR